MLLKNLIRRLRLVSGREGLGRVEFGENGWVHELLLYMCVLSLLLMKRVCFSKRLIGLGVACSLSPKFLLFGLIYM